MFGRSLVLVAATLCAALLFRCPAQAACPDCMAVATVVSANQALPVLETQSQTCSIATADSTGVVVGVASVEACTARRTHPVYRAAGRLLRLPALLIKGAWKARPGLIFRR